MYLAQISILISNSNNNSHLVAAIFQDNLDKPAPEW